MRQLTEQTFSDKSLFKELKGSEDKGQIEPQRFYEFELSCVN